MSDYGYFWNSRNGDRVYSADSMEDWLKPFFVTGVFNGELQVTAAGNMNIAVDEGYCNVNGKTKHFAATQIFTLEPASGVLDRIDTVVIERNDIERNITIKVITGDSSGAPAAPVRDEGIYQLVIAQVLVRAGVIEITQSSITDTRMESALCGYVCSTVNEINFDQAVIQFKQFFREFQTEQMNSWLEWSNGTKILFTRWMESEENEFDEWFKNLQIQLDGNVAGHLQNEIDSLREKLANFAETGEMVTPIADDTSRTITDEQDEALEGSVIYVTNAEFEKYKQGGIA